MGILEKRLVDLERGRYMGYVVLIRGCLEYRNCRKAILVAVGGGDGRGS